MKEKYCKFCIMTNQRPHIEFSEDGICQPCINAAKRKKITKEEWKKREEKLKELCDKYRRDDGYYDVLIPGSGGKDTWRAVMVMKSMGMHPLVVKVSDSFHHTKTGEYNLKTMCEEFKTDLITYNQNPSTERKMAKIAFEEMGSPNWPIDQNIYVIPLKFALKLNIPFVIYGESISYIYGGKHGTEETYNAKDQIKNNVVIPLDWDWWFERGITIEDIEFMKYPKPEEIDKLEIVYLSYFVNWDGRQNLKLAKEHGFKTLCDTGEMNRIGFIDDFDQIDSTHGYIIHPQLKYPKFGHCRITDMLCNDIRNGYITRKEAVKIYKENDESIFDPIALKDFCETLDITEKEFYETVDKLYNKDIFKKVDGKWIKKVELK